MEEIKKCLYLNFRERLNCLKIIFRRLKNGNLNNFSASKNILFMNEKPVGVINEKV